MDEAEVVGGRGGARIGRIVGAVALAFWLLAPAPPAASARASHAPTAAQARVVSARAGLVTLVEGEVRCHHHEREGGVEELRAGERIDDGDIVFTNETGRAQWTLNPDSYLSAAPGSTVHVYDTRLERMSFGVARGEVVIVARSLGKDVSLTIRTPASPIKVYKAGLYRFRVADDGETEAEVVEGELRYQEKGKEVRLKKGRKVNFRRTAKGVEHER